MGLTEDTPMDRNDRKASIPVMWGKGLVLFCCTSKFWVSSYQFKIFLLKSVYPVPFPLFFFSLPC